MNPRKVRCIASYSYARTTYKNIRDLMYEATSTGMHAPALAGEAATVTLPFKFLASRELTSATGAELRITLSEDTAWSGSHVSITFYALSSDE